MLCRNGIARPPCVAHAGTLGRQGLPTSACPFCCPNQERSGGSGCFLLLSSTLRLAEMPFFFPAKVPSQGVPCVLLPQQQPAHRITQTSLLTKQSQLPRYLFLALAVTLPSHPGKLTNEAETRTCNLQHAICVASYLAGALVPGVPRIYLRIDHVVSKIKWKVIVIVDYIIRKQESECLTNGNTWNTCTKT